jgi:hypothetical protein
MNTTPLLGPRLACGGFYAFSCQLVMLRLINAAFLRQTCPDGAMCPHRVPTLHVEQHGLTH